MTVQFGNKSAIVSILTRPMPPIILDESPVPTSPSPPWGFFFLRSPVPETAMKQSLSTVQLCSVQATGDAPPNDVDEKDQNRKHQGPSDSGDKHPWSVSLILVGEDLAGVSSNGKVAFTVDESKSTLGSIGGSTCLKDGRLDFPAVECPIV
eukprot:CAMPEP_0176182656 /NCGR_PEP_ID=MMETSP0120_2-20121206/93587_1 /TAXON_ID=160619 /ORGANISM="Kryptoperidinium foliaceum, Strain CCMP 1326" /LENGTH=150 /DNA_ID=CAMNT_0017520907 /DNA_START=105 /DNA_END=558 /DNA_ORIENTATION=-